MFSRAMWHDRHGFWGSIGRSGSSRGAAGGSQDRQTTTNARPDHEAALAIWRSWPRIDGCRLSQLHEYAAQWGYRASYSPLILSDRAINDSGFLASWFGLFRTSTHGDGGLGANPCRWARLRARLRGAHRSWPKPTPGLSRHLLLDRRLRAYVLGRSDRETYWDHDDPSALCRHRPVPTNDPLPCLSGTARPHRMTCASRRLWMSHYRRADSGRN
jgi:hypothetical protein